MNDYLQTKREGERRKRRRKIKLIVFSCIGILCIAAAIAVLRSSLLDIKNISIQGDGAVDPQHIDALVQATMQSNTLLSSVLFSKKNIFLVSDNAIKQNIMSTYPFLKNVTISKNIFSGSIDITLQQRDKYGVWCTPQENNISFTSQATSTALIASSTSGKKVSPTPTATTTPIPTLSYSGCWWFDEQGTIFMSAPSMQGDSIHKVIDQSLHPITIGSQIPLGDNTTHLIEIFNFLDSINAPVQTVLYDNPQLEEVQTAPTPHYPTIYFNLTQNPQFAFDAIKNMGDTVSSLSYIDLRVANRIYYK